MLYTSWGNECKEYLAQQEGRELDDVEKEVYNLAYPRSHCPSCNAMVKSWQNIPVISYLILGGKCGSCKTPISIRYPLVEIFTGFITAFIIYFFGANQQGYLAVLFTWCLICLTMIDIDEQLLPDNITLPLLWLGLLVNTANTYTTLYSAVIGAAAGYLILWTIYWLFKLTTGKEGMGFGDFKLLAALGAWLGWEMLPFIIIASSFVGAVVGIGNVVLQDKDKNKPIPFGPYLAIAGWVAMFWGEQITNNYIQFLAS